MTKNAYVSPNAVTKMSRNKSRFLNWLGIWRSCSNTAEQHWLVILVSAGIGSFVNRGAIVQSDKSAWMTSERRGGGMMKEGVMETAQRRIKMGDNSFILPNNYWWNVNHSIKGAALVTRRFMYDTLWRPEGKHAQAQHPALIKYWISGRLEYSVVRQGQTHPPTHVPSAHTANRGRLKLKPAARV